MRTRGFEPHDVEVTTTPVVACGVSADRLHVVVAVAHRAMRTLIVDLLHHDHVQWAVSAIDSPSQLGDAVLSNPDLVILDTADFAACCCELPRSFALGRIVVIGPEPDKAYRQVALRCGAGAWLSREHGGEELSSALLASLTCSHVSLPPSDGRPRRSAPLLPTTASPC